MCPRVGLPVSALRQSSRSTPTNGSSSVNTNPIPATGSSSAAVSTAASNDAHVSGPAQTQSLPSPASQESSFVSPPRLALSNRPTGDRREFIGNRVYLNHRRLHHISVRVLIDSVSTTEADCSTDPSTAVGVFPSTTAASYHSPEPEGEPAFFINSEEGFRVAIFLVPGFRRPDPVGLALAQSEPRRKLSASSATRWNLNDGTEVCNRLRLESA